MATELQESTKVTAVKPIDLTGVRDSGIAALVSLAVSLGWNAIIKHNNPILLVARDGVQKRLPTNTSVRMSVFQSALSTIMTHSGDQEPTVELIDVIVKQFKIDRDHEQRLRIAIGETTKEHRDRLAAIDAEAKGPREPEPLTTRIELPPMVDEQVEQILSDHENLLPADGEEHGALISVERFKAHYKGNRQTGTVKLYESDTSNERVWEDGYKDYECVVCGKVFSTPRGVGSHKQYHIRDGDIPAPDVAAWKRAEPIGVVENYVPGKRRTKVEVLTEQGIDFENVEFVDEVPEDEAMLPDNSPITVTPDEFGLVREPPIVVPGDRAEVILAQITDLVLPRVIAANQAEMDELKAENQRLQEALDKITANWNALKEMLSEGG